MVTPARSRPAHVRNLITRAAITVIAAYVFALGGTLTGVLVVEFQIASLAVLTTLVSGWLIVVCRQSIAATQTRVALLVLIWLLVCGISVWRNPSARSAIGAWWLAFYAGLGLLLADVVSRGVKPRWVIDAVAIAMIPVMLIAIVQVQRWYLDWLALDTVGVGFIPLRPPGTLGNANALGAALAITVPFGIARLQQARRNIDRALWAVWLAGAVGVLYLTYSRGAWLGAGLALLVLSTQFWSTIRRWLVRPYSRATIPIILVILLAAVTAGVTLLGTAQVFDTPRRETGTRLEFIRIAWDTFRVHPIAGRGPLSYGLSLLENRSSPPEQPQAHAHNLVFNVAAELGSLGIGALAIAVAYSGTIGLRHMRDDTDPEHRTYRRASAAALAAFITHSMFDMPSVVPAVSGLALIAWAVVIGPSSGPHSPPARTPARRTYAIFAAILWAGVLASAWWSAAHYRVYTRGESQLAASRFTDGTATLHETVQMWPGMPLYHAEYGYGCGLAVSAGDSSCLEDGIAAYLRALDLEPQHAVWWANVAILLWADGQSEAALAAMQQATVRAPQSADLWLNLGRLNEMAGREQDAFTAYSHALGLDDRWANIRFWDETPVRRAALQNSGVGPSAYEQAVALWQTGNQSEAIAVLQAPIGRDPSQPRPYTQLARLHVANGMLQHAEDYLDAARVLAHTVYDDAWIAIIEAEAARAQGDQTVYESRMDRARTLLWPDQTGHRLPYGLDVAYLQFWRVRVGGVLLPQLLIYQPDPELHDILMAWQPTNLP